jgi:hypothetical protein
MDAQISYAFHSERKLHPEKFKNQLVNQVPFEFDLLDYTFSFNTPSLGFILNKE